MKDVMILTGAGQIGMAIARRTGSGKKIVVGDKSPDNAGTVCKILNEAGFDAMPVEMDLASRDSILQLIAEAHKQGEIAMLVNAAGVSPSQAPIEVILKVDLYGTAVLLEEMGRVIRPGGAGVTISSQSGHHGRRGNKLPAFVTQNANKLFFKVPQSLYQSWEPFLFDIVEDLRQPHYTGKQ